MALPLDEGVVEDLYMWIDGIKLSRPKRDLRRDFSDGVLVAEVVKHFFPVLVDLHNYSATLAVNKKAVNWHMLNRKVFKKLGFEVTDDVIKNVTTCQPWSIEHFLILLRSKIDEREERERGQSSRLRNKSDENDVGKSPVSSKGKIHLEESCPFSNGDAASRASNSINNPVDPSLEVVDFRDRQIEMLLRKTDQLENLLRLKDIRIEDLQTRVKQLENQLAEHR